MTTPTATPEHLPRFDDYRESANARRLCRYCRDWRTAHADGTCTVCGAVIVDTS